MRSRPRFLVLNRHASRIVARTIAALPTELKPHAIALPLLFRRRPSRAMGQDGIASDSLGLFVGTPYALELSTDLPAPAQIFLFLENLWDYTGELRAFNKEVRITYLHELGHYLNLDESDLTRRGLE